MTAQMEKENGSAASLQELQAGMERLERREWWRWAAALVIMLLLTLGVFSLSLPGMGKDTSKEDQLGIAVRGLFALVLLFDVFAIYQQVLITRMRRQLAGQIGSLAALDAFKPATSEPEAGHKERRRCSRYHFDQRLRVTATMRGKEAILYGRVVDISEFGLGAVISGSLQRGDSVSLNFDTDTGALTLTAVIRSVNGFRHGFEFATMGPADLQSLKLACLAAASTIPS
jgi:hypothetical protein